MTLSDYLMDRAITIVGFLAPIAGLLVLWEVAVATGVAQSSILPAPSAIAVRGYELLGGGDAHSALLLTHIAASLKRALIAFVLAVAVGVPLGFLLGLNRQAYLWISPILSLMLPLPGGRLDADPAGGVRPWRP